jgi:peptidyl-prolyl cis-trans isomerase D
MLDSLRRIGRTWFGKVLGAFLIVGLAGFGISNVLLDFGANNVAKVGEDDITIRDFQRAYNDDLSRFAQQFGQMPTAQEALAMGVPSNTLSRLASDAAVNRLGLDMGIGVSEDRLIRLLRQDPSFAGTLGNFDPENFPRVLQQLGYTEAEYFEIQAKAARRQQISAGLFADSVIPVAAQELLGRFSGDTRSIDYFVVNSQSILPVAEPTEEELAAYLTEHQQEFRTAETRTADVLVLSIETLAATQEVTDDEVAAEYERTKDSRVRIEKRTIVQTPLATDAQAGWFERGKAAGRSFDNLVADTGVALTELGTLARSEVTDPALAEAAFGLEASDFAIIPGVGGQRVIAVTAIEPGGVITLDESRDEIRQSLANGAARDAYVDILDQIEELRAAFQPLSQVAERFALPVHEVTLTASGAELESVPGLAEELRPRVASGIFAAEQDKLAPTIAVSANNNIWFDLKAVEPARDQTLDEVRDEVVAALTAERENAAVVAEVEAIMERLKAGEAFADVALSLNLFPQLSQPMTRSGDDSTQLDQAVASAAFSGGEGHFGSAINGDGDHVVFQVVEITPAAEQDTTQLDAYLEDSTRQSLLGDFVTGLRDAAGIRVNQQTLDQILALDATGQ